MCLEVNLCFCTVSLLFGSEPAVSRNPQGDARQLVEEFRSQFGATHPPFLVQSYDEVIVVVVATVKPLYSGRCLGTLKMAVIGC